ncbi:hypothetical protein [Breznakiella homolactica]|uniref:Uncharacterized protein n=1 Tax=Breznakiella homolactica TaxID=2798577 RepID=A0A7T8BC27_9SPIR|nr:hypothetical protein [Breznakiella homolactica]QQO11001.1 hypothetical protein JFL75_08810 [Breznakiella homolactica]
MDTIKALSYYNEILINTSLYKYLTAIVSKTDVAEILDRIEYGSLIETTKAFLEDKNDTSVEGYTGRMLEKYRKYMGKTLDQSRKGIGNNLLVSSFTTFELFLGHLVTVYCGKFSRLYSDEQTGLSYSTLRQIKNDAALQDFFIESFIEKFTAFNFTEKISYVKKTLKLSYDDIWMFNGREYMYDINAIRNRIILSGDSPGIAEDDFYRYLNYLCSLIFKISAYSQAKYGIPFEWIDGTNFTFRFSHSDVL